MSLIETYEFNSIIDDIANHEEFLKLKEELHHGISRYEHSMRVAKVTYKMTKKLHLDYERATRAALLHDFFFDENLKEYNSKETLKLHPEYALQNALKYFDVDTKQANMIRAHMYPVYLEKPKYAESWLLTVADKIVAAHEMYRYKAALTNGIWTIFLFNMITIQK